jgi:hypothetical protein
MCFALLATLALTYNAECHAQGTSAIPWTCSDVARYLPLQVWVGVVRRGPTGQPLNSSYQNRSNARYLEDLGNAIVNFARVVPDGLLVFFPSYNVLTSCLDAWKLTAGGWLDAWQ